MPVRIQIIGGFLGAGKTTLITKMAKKLMEDGMKVGIIMNDQADSLVDTQYSKELGLDCCEVAGGCFCCRFPDFLENARDLVKSGDPALILAEPVGSCTDLMATVAAPLKRVYGNEFQVVPLIIMVDADRAARNRMNDDSLGGYLRQHQISEAEYVVLSKVDLVNEEYLESISSKVNEINPRARVIPYSIGAEDGLDAILSLVLSEEESRIDPREIDYQVYAEAEAELGWYNGTFHAKVESLDAYLLCRELLENISSRFPVDDVAHAKIMLVSESNAAKMSAVMGRVSIDAVGGSRFASGETRITINARIAADPQMLRMVVNEAVDLVANRFGLILELIDEDSFSPAAPNPTYRMK